MWFAYAPNTDKVIYSYGPFDPPVPTDVTLGVDYGYDVPLRGVPWETLGLSDQLIRDLRTWQALFENTHDPFAEPPDGGPAWHLVRSQWTNDMRSLIERLRVELPADVRLVADDDEVAWPLSGGPASE